MIAFWQKSGLATTSGKKLMLALHLLATFVPVVIATSSSL